jgi:GTP-binding protein SAR1
MGWFDWVFDSLSFFGLYYKESKILFLGLDNAGKTTLLQMLKSSTLASHTPTFHPNAEELIIGNVRFHTHDLGGHEAARRLWKDYYTTVDGIVYVVDALDRDRFPEAREELNAILADDVLAHVPILVLGNKIDAFGAVSEHELRSALALYQTTGKNGDAINVRPIEVFMCSVVRKMGYRDGFEWLSKYQ